MSPMFVYKGVIALWFGVWGAFAFLPSSKSETSVEHIRNSVPAPYVALSTTAPPSTLPTIAVTNVSQASMFPIPLVSYWEKIAKCETDSNWEHKGGNGAGHYYEGGLGIYDGTWDNWGGNDFGNHAYQATKEQQIIVANRIALFGFKEVRSRTAEQAKAYGIPTTYVHEKDAVGFNGWGCNRRNGAPPLFYYPDPERFLTTRFEFNQRGVEVHDLQQLLGVKADGWYGNATQNAHLKYLNKANLPTNVVPAIKPSPKNGYEFVEWNGDVAQIPVDATKRCPQYEAKFAEHGLPPEIFSYIAWRESRCNPKSENWTLNANGSSDHGLVQINSSWKTVVAESCGSKRGDLTVLLNVDCNLKVAKRLLETSADPLGNWRL